MYDNGPLANERKDPEGEVHVRPLLCGILLCAMANLVTILLCERWRHDAPALTSTINSFQTVAMVIAGLCIVAWFLTFYVQIVLRANVPDE